MIHIQLGFLLLSESDSAIWSDNLIINVNSEGRSEVIVIANFFPLEEVWSAEVAQYGVQGSDQERRPGELARVTDISDNIL